MMSTEWVRYLKESGNYEHYDGMCNCYQCKEIRDGFDTWKAKSKEMSIQQTIQQIKERADKATPGLWYHRQEGERDRNSQEYDWIADAPKHHSKLESVLP